MLPFHSLQAFAWACSLLSLHAMAKDFDSAGSLRDYLLALHYNLQDPESEFAFPVARRSCNVVLGRLPSSFGGGPSANLVDRQAGEYLLILVSQTSCTEIPRRLLAYGINPDCALPPACSEEFEGLTPLIHAALNGQLGVCQMLVEAGASVDKHRACDAASLRNQLVSRSAGLIGCTALIAAACEGHVEVARYVSVLLGFYVYKQAEIPDYLTIDPN